MNAGDGGNVVPLGTMIGGPAAINPRHIRRPLDDAAGIVAGQARTGAGAVIFGLSRKREQQQGNGEYPAHRKGSQKWLARSGSREFRPGSDRMETAPAPVQLSPHPA